ncbi:MAG: flavin reductase family protein [Bacteroidetes bacterium]|nr:flavin reductase family protein [Bacteroidota bacterium]
MSKLPETQELTPLIYGQQEHKHLTYHFTYGVYLITSAAGDTKSGMTAVWVTQVSKNPVRLAIGIQPEGQTAKNIEASGKFCVQVLSRLQEKLAYQFGAPAAPGEDKFSEVTWNWSPAGNPVIHGTIAWMDCEAEQTLNLGSHLLVIARVTGGDSVSGQQPAVYLNGKINPF